MFSLADSGIQKWRCYGCFSNFHSERILVKHLREVPHLDLFQNMADDQAGLYEDYPSTDDYKCKHCDKGYITQGGLTKHEKDCKSKPSYICIHCNKAYTTQGGLSKHEKDCKSKPSCICKHCDKGYTTQGELTKHEKDCKSKPSCIYSCVSCSLPFNTKGGLTNHRRSCADALSDRNIKQLTSLKM